MVALLLLPLAVPIGGAADAPATLALSPRADSVSLKYIELLCDMECKSSSIRLVPNILELQEAPDWFPAVLAAFAVSKIFHVLRLNKGTQKLFHRFQGIM